MTNNEIIEPLLSDIREWCENTCKKADLVDDLYQEIVLVLLTYDNEKLNTAKDNKWLKYFIIRIISNNCNSSTSPFYIKFRKFNLELQDHNEEPEIEADEDDVDDLIEHNLQFIEAIVNKLHWYDRELFCMYFKILDYNKVNGDKADPDCKKVRMSFRDIEKKTGINYGSVCNTVNQSLETIRKQLIEINIL